MAETNGWLKGNYPLSWKSASLGVSPSEALFAIHYPLKN